MEESRETGILHVLPQDIEKMSFQIIEEELRQAGRTIPEDRKHVLLRVIHTTADFEYFDTMAFSEGALERAEDALRRGAHIVTDTTMAMSGINKRKLAELGGDDLRGGERAHSAAGAGGKDPAGIQAGTCHCSAGRLRECHHGQRAHHEDRRAVYLQSRKEGRQRRRGGDLQCDPVSHHGVKKWNGMHTSKREGKNSGSGTRRGAVRQRRQRRRS